MRDNEYNQSEVAYETKGPKEPKADGSPINCEFPGNKMPQGNTWVKPSKVKSKETNRIYGEHR